MMRQQEPRKIEAEVSAMLKVFAADLDRLPPVGEAVTERIKTAVRDEINEQWLAAQLPLRPAAETVDSVRAAVHEELRRQATFAQCASSTKREAGWRAVLGGLAAAAMIGLCIGLIQFVGQRTVPAHTRLAGAVPMQAIDTFVEAAEIALALDESAIASRAFADALTGVSEDDVFEELSEAMQDILSSSEQDGSTRIDPAAEQGAVG